MTSILSDETPIVTPETDNTPVIDKDGKVDVEKLAKRLADKDAFIERLKTETAGLRSELATRTRLEELVEKINSPEESPKKEGSPAPQPKPDSTEWTPERIAAIVDEQVTKKATESRRQANIRAATEKLKTAFGATYKETVKQKMEALSLDEAAINEIAAKSPQALLDMMGAKNATKEENSSSPFAPPRSKVNTTAFAPETNEKGWKHFEAMRRSEDPKVRAQYWSPSVQNELHKIVQEMANKGVDFRTT